ncbi:hypothetical protein Cgig2_015415 [Carnegiea gigantea]|uniref:Ubiquitin-like domain-containing protein n=1 Tax=Carnegiea gigantea TaxID=171969 RepID=A0A9Q1K2F5_9CARY|nr:hypothetical protein Cgig2_015415 [Carnegiea gigantea]
MMRLPLTTTCIHTPDHPQKAACCCTIIGQPRSVELFGIHNSNCLVADVRLSGNPVADPGKGGIPRFVLIARLSKVETLNGSEVKPRERKESEIRYVRSVMSKFHSNQEEVRRCHPRRDSFAGVKLYASDPICSFPVLVGKLPWPTGLCRAAKVDGQLKRMPDQWAPQPTARIPQTREVCYSRRCRLKGSHWEGWLLLIRIVDQLALNSAFLQFYELQSLHGLEDERPSSGAAGPQKMGSGLLTVTLKCVGASFGEKSPLMKKLPATTTVGKLKNLCESFFKLKSIKLKLFLQEEGSPLPILLDNEMESLLDAGVGNESTILVDEEC